MNWKSIEIEMPSREVLAVNNRKDFIVGYCSEQNGKYTCESDDQVLENVTHWMSLDELWNAVPN